MTRQKDTEANILWTLDMHDVVLKYSGTCWKTLIRMPLWRQGLHTFSFASFQYFSTKINFLAANHIPRNIGQHAKDKTKVQKYIKSDLRYS